MSTNYTATFNDTGFYPPVTSSKVNQEEYTEIKEDKTISNKTKTVVVYNKYNMEAVLSAAIIKQHVDVEVYEASLPISDYADKYVWLGVTPNPGMFGGKEVWEKEHLVATSGYPLRSFSMKYGKPNYKEVETQTLEYTTNTTSKIMDYFNIREEKYLGLVEMVHRFYDKNMDLDTLAYVYQNVKNAEESLTTGVFTLEAPSLEQLHAYMVAVKKAKAELKDNYALKEVSIKGKHKTVIITCNVKDFWLIRRLSGFVYDTYVNTSMMLRGPSVHSNIDVSQIIDFSNVTSMS